LSRYDLSASQNGGMGHLPRAPFLADRTILIVDDEPLVANVLAQELLDLGCAEAIEANGGVEALAALRDRPEVSVLLCDVRMPDLDGPEVVRRAVALRPDLKVVFVTGYAGGLDTGGWPVLDKPVDTRRLALALERALRR